MEGVPCGTAKRYSRLQSLGPRAQLHRTTRYSLPYGTHPKGPRRGCTVPWRTLRVARGTVTNAEPDMRDGRNDVNIERAKRHKEVRFNGVLRDEVI